MDFSVQRNDLLKSLQQIMGIIDPRAHQPILSNCLINTKTKQHEGSYIEITATNIEQGFRDIIDANVKIGGTITLPAKKLHEIAKETSLDCNLRFTLDDKRVLIQSGRASFYMPDLPISDQPTMPEFNEDEVVSISVYNLAVVLSKVFYAISTEEMTGPNGLLFTLGKDFIEAIATDGRRLAYANKMCNCEAGEQKSYLLPRAGVVNIRKLLTEYDGRIEGNVEMNFSDNLVMLRKDKQLFYTRLINKTFPPVRKLLDQNYDKSLTVDKDKLLHALRRVSLMVDEETRQIIVSLENTTMTIKSSDVSSWWAEETLDITYNHDPFAFAINSKYLLDAVKNVDDDEVLIKLISPDNAICIEASGQPNFVNVVMPMRL